MNEMTDHHDLEISPQTFESTAPVATPEPDAMPESVASREARAAASAFADLDERRAAALEVIAQADRERAAISASAAARRDPKSAIRRARDAALTLLDHSMDTSTAAQPYREMLAANAALFDAMLGT